MTDSPETYNEIVKLIENNDSETAAQVVKENFTPNSKIRELEKFWRKHANEKDGEEYFYCADKLRSLIND